MDRNQKEFQKLLTLYLKRYPQGKKYTHQTFSQQPRTLHFPRNPTRPELKHHHIASNIEKLYSPFQANYYLPPHLNSSQSSGKIHYGQCKNWKPKDTFNKQNYDRQYQEYEKRVEGLVRYNWPVSSAAKYAIDQDRQDYSGNQKQFQLVD